MERARVGPQEPEPATATAGRGASSPAFERRSIGPVAVLLLLETRLQARAWGWLNLALGGPLLHDVPGLRFAKMLGCGHGGGFGPRPSLSRQGLFLGFADEPAARGFVEGSDLVRRYRRHAREYCVAVLRAAATKGSWDGAAMPVTACVAPGEPMAVLTRASLRPSRLVDFWRLAPASEAGLNGASGCRLAAGLGEVPWARQCTFSVWDDTASMEAYARTAAHRRAAHAAQVHGFFSEAMFVRFAVLDLQGRWKARVYEGGRVAGLG